MCFPLSTLFEQVAENLCSLKVRRTELENGIIVRHLFNGSPDGLKRPIGQTADVGLILFLST